MSILPPVIAIDGPTASGKGTVAACVAATLGWHFLDSGAIYRVLAWAALQKKISLENTHELVTLSQQLDVRFEGTQVWLAEVEISADLRQEKTGQAASQIATQPPVREALLSLQRAFRKPPGLVADGRDMGSVVFPDAVLKIFLTASAQIRAERRYKQLIEKGISANINTLLQDLLERDARDTSRSVAPLEQSEDAVLLETTNCSADEAVQFVLNLAAKRFNQASHTDRSPSRD